MRGHRVVARPAWTPLAVVGTVVALLVVLCCQPLSSARGATSPVSGPTAAQVTFAFTENGVPQQFQKFFTLNYATAFAKIKTGDFSEADVHKAEFASAMRAYGTPGSETAAFNVPGATAVIGRGHSYSDYDTSVLLYQLAKVDIRVLQEMNGTSAGTINTHSAPSNQKGLRSPGDSSKQVTDSQGKLVGRQLPLGPTLVMDSDSQPVAVVTIASQTTQVTVDLAHPFNTVSITYQGLSADRLVAPDTYCVDMTDQFVIHLSLSPEQTETTNTLVLTIPRQISITPPQIAGASIAWPTSALYRLSFEVPASPGGFSLDIQAHLATKDSGVDFYHQGIFNDEAGSTVAVTAHSAYGFFGVTSQGVTTSGINFVQYDARAAKYVTGGLYQLEKKVGDQTLVYSTTGQWVPAVAAAPGASAQNPSAQAGQPAAIQPGNRYVIGVPQPAAIRGNRFSSSPASPQQVRDSLIQVYGLAPGAYSLRQISAPTSQPKLAQPIDFTVFWSAHLSPNGESTVYTTSLTRAVNQSYAANSQIPDQASGYNEYNVLDVSQSGSGHQASQIRVAAAVLAVLVLAILVLMVLAVVKW